MKIELVNKFFIVSEIAEMAGLTTNNIWAKIKSLELTEDIKINNFRAYSSEKTNKILGFYKYEKEYWEIINESKFKEYIDLSETDAGYQIFESSMNER